MQVKDLESDNFLDECSETKVEEEVSQEEIESIESRTEPVVSRGSMRRSVPPLEVLRRSCLFVDLQCSWFMGMYGKRRLSEPVHATSH